MAKKLVKLTFPQNLIKEPITFRMAKQFDLMPNIRRAKVTETIGELILELEGSEKNLENGLKFISDQGIIVEPVVGDVIE